jgi:limonene-1,2-epoxide hydrolase
VVKSPTNARVSAKRNIEIIRSAYAADSREDASGAVQHFAPDIEWHWWGRTLHGRTEVKEMLEGLYPLAETHNKIERIAATKHHVLVRRFFSFQWKDGALVSGRRPRRRGGRGFDLWTMEQDRIVAYRGISYRRQVIRAVGFLTAVRLRRALLF